MKIRVFLLAASSAIALSFVAPASANELSTREYVANIRQHIAFLDQASQLAAARSQDEQIRAFAKKEATAQHANAAALKAWEKGDPTGGLEIASAEPNGSGEVATGRSVGLDEGWHTDTGVLMASPGVIVMPRLSALQGDDFDTLYATTQVASLKELAGFYEAYGKTGDDPALRALALRELPLVKQHIAELDAL